MGAERLEPITKSPEKQGVTPERGTESGTLPADSDVVAAWPALPPAIRRAVLALIGVKP
jgi:hypothetical protein